jgi:transcriptional regulator with XRE-family HTH domain/anti-sigma regulatory factor (Ser/Thr protein kinase)
VAGEVIPLGARLRQRREELGLTQAQAARELEVARTAYRLWEMEAARPAPDRWRLIAKWLGLSVNAMLLAGELIDADEAHYAETAAQEAGLTGESWDQQSGAEDADFFSQERLMIADQERLGNLSLAQVKELRDLLDRLQLTSEDGVRDDPFHPGRFRKRFPCTDAAPALARTALLATATGIATDTLEEASLLISELVTNSVRHSRSAWIDVEITLDSKCLRIAVTDQDTRSIRPRTPGAQGGWGLTLVGELSTRWGVERQKSGKTIWVEFDL